MRLSNVVLDDHTRGPTTDDRVERVGLAIDQVVGADVGAHLEHLQTRRKQGLLVGGALAALGLVLLVTGSLSLGVGVLLAGAAVAGALFTYTEYASPDVSVKRVDRGYWTGHRIPATEGVYVHDATGAMPTTEFELELVQDVDAIETLADDLNANQEYPPVMAADGGVETSLLDRLEDVQAELDAADRHAVELPLVRQDTPAAGALEQVARRADADAVETVTAVSAADAAERTDDLAELEEMAGDADNADLPRIEQAGEDIERELTHMQSGAVTTLNKHVEMAADVFGIVSYHFYCPDCLKDDIESRLVPKEVTERRLYCETCRTEHTIEDGVPRHRIKDDLVNPMTEGLWTEKDDQRREIYENIEDQKTDLKEREYEQRREEIRSNADRVKELQSRIRDLQTQARAAKNSHEKMGNLMTKYDRLNQKRKREFNRHIESTFEEIEAQTQQVIEQTRNDDQELLDEAMDAAEEKAELMREEERRLEAQKLMAQQEMVKAQMKQRQQHHEELMEHHEQTHREEWLRETRGGTSASTLVNKAKVWKDRTFGYSGNGTGGGH